jgi:ABC-type tungstate transport system substrate-binding protein
MQAQAYRQRSDAHRESVHRRHRCAAVAPPMNSIADSLLLAAQLISRADADLWRVVGLSLRVSATACAIGATAGLCLGAWLAVARFRGHGVAVWLVNSLLALPSVVVGLLVYLLLSRSGPLGPFGLLFTPPAMIIAQAALIALGEWGILFTPTAMVIAQSLLVVPLIAALARRLVLDGLRDGGDQLRSLGAGPFTSALLMLLHERFGVLTVLLTAFGRAVSEVGAVMIVGGNIDGFTRVMTTAIALETSKGDLPLALGLGFVLLAVVGVVNGVILLLQGRTSIEREAYV